MNLRMRLKTVFALLSAITLTVNAQENTPTMELTLDKAIELALSDNPTIKVAEKEIELKEVSKAEAWQNLLPQVSLDGAIQYNIQVASMKMDMSGQTMEIKMGKDGSNTWNAALQVAIPLYAPAVYKAMSITESDLQLAVEKSRGSKIDLVNQVTKAFYQLMLAQDSYEVLNENYNLAKANFDIVNMMYEQGKVSEYDKISAEVQMRNLQPSVISARNAVELSRLQLVVLMNIEPETEFVLDGNLGDYEETVFAGVLSTDESSLKNNSSLQQMDLNPRMLQQTLALNKQNFAPIVALQFNYMYTCMANDFKFKDYEWNPYSNISLSLSVPLFKYSNFSAMKKTNIQISQMMKNRDYTERQLAMQQQSYLNSMAASAEQVSSNKEAIIQAQKGRDIAEKLYEVGRGTVLELNSAEVALTQAKLTYTQAIYDYLSAKADLDKLQGKE